MLRSTRPLLASSSRAIASQKSSVSSLQRWPLQPAASAAKLNAEATRPRSLRPTQLSPLVAPGVQRWHATKPPPRMQSARDPEEEKKFGAKKLESNPEAVTTTSSVRQVWEPDSREEAAEKPVREGIQHDLVRKSCPSIELPMEEYP